MMRLDWTTLTGGCRCGRCRYALRTVTEVVACHCHACQAASGADCIVWVCAETTALEWTGAPELRASSAVAGRGYCPACGMLLSMAYYQTGEVAVAALTLDRPVPPVDRHIHTCHASILDR